MQYCPETGDLAKPESPKDNQLLCLQRYCTIPSLAKITRVFPTGPCVTDVEEAELVGRNKLGRNC